VRLLLRWSCPGRDSLEGLCVSAGSAVVPSRPPGYCAHLEHLNFVVLAAV
jgi:hypothetical protein